MPPGPQPAASLMLRDSRESSKLSPQEIVR